MPDPSLVSSNSAPDTDGAAISTSPGSNHLGIRLYNERLILSLIRRHKTLPKAEIARLTALSAQTATVIVNRLETDGLVRREAKRRGRVGQPSIPYALDPEGAFGIGFKIGRRSADVMIIDFLGRVVTSRRDTYRYPERDRLLKFALESVDALTGSLNEERRTRIAGLGIAMPYEMWKWSKEMGAPAEVLEFWRGFDIAATFRNALPWPVYIYNDATAACAAELVFGEGHRFSDFLYLYIGSFVGGGIVLGGNVFPGSKGNAGALGSMIVPGGENGHRQLIKAASIYVLERKCEMAGIDPSDIWLTPEQWDEPDHLVSEWIDEAAMALALATTSARAVIDFEAVIIDGALPPPIRSRLVTTIQEKNQEIEQDGLSPIDFVEGTIGAYARAIGGASLPLLANFAQDREVLFKDIARVT